MARNYNTNAYRNNELNRESVIHVSLSYESAQAELRSEPEKKKAPKLRPEDRVKWFPTIQAFMDKHCVWDVDEEMWPKAYPKCDCEMCAKREGQGGARELLYEKLRLV